MCGVKEEMQGAGSKGTLTITTLVDWGGNLPLFKFNADMCLDWKTFANLQAIITQVSFLCLISFLVNI